MQRHDLSQDAVDSVSHSQETRLGFEVYVRRIPLNRIGQNRVNEPDKRMVVLLIFDRHIELIDFARIDLSQDALY